MGINRTYSKVIKAPLYVSLTLLAFLIMMPKDTHFLSKIIANLSMLILTSIPIMGVVYLLASFIALKDFKGLLYSVITLAIIAINTVWLLLYD